MEHRLKFGQKFAYGLGDFGSNFCFSFITSFALIYFTDIVGANAAVIGTLLFISKCFDGFTDIIMGNLIDRTSTKMGKARPWLFGSTFPLAIALIMLFNVPSTLSASGKNIYIFIVYTLLCAFFYTASNISYNTLMSLVTDNAKDRVSMGSIRFICTAIAGIIIGSVTNVLINQFGSGQKGWSAVAILYAIIFTIFTLITVFGTKEMRAAADKNHETKNNSVTLSKSLQLLFKNRYFLLMFGVFLFLYIFTGVSGTAGVYYATYILGDANLFGLLSIAMMLPMFLGLGITPKLAEKMGMQKTCIIGSIVFMIGAFTMVISQNSLIIVIVGIVIRSLGMAPISATMYALVAETAKYTALKEKINIEGMIYSCSSIGIKVGSGLGTALVGWLLAWGNYDGTLNIQHAMALNMISVSYLIIPLITAVILLLLFLMTDVEKANHRLEESIMK